MSRGRSKETEHVVASVQDLATPSNPTTVRFLLYKLISTGVLQSTAQYEKLVTIIRDARIRGELDDDCFVDNKRTMHSSATWSDLTDYKDTIRTLYERDKWLTQKNRPIILVEKGTVGDVLKRICGEYQVPLFVSSGYYSRPFLCKLADLIIKRCGPVQIGYVGDGDPSGFDIERAAKMGNGEDGSKRREGLMEIIIKKCHEYGRGDAEEICLGVHDGWKRLAITDEDLGGFTDFQLVPVKEGDTRTERFIVEHGVAAERDSSFYGAEVEALDQAILQDRVREFIELYTDSVAWAETLLLEEADLRTLSELQ